MKSTHRRLQKLFRTHVLDRFAKPSPVAPRRGADFGSVVAWTAALVCWTLLSHLASPLPSRAEASQDSASPGEHVFTESAINRVASALETARCVGSIEPVVRTQPCDARALKAWKWSAPNDVRNAMGEAPCWWHANVEDLSKISGITEAWADRIVQERTADIGPYLRIPQELESVLGAHRTRLLVEGVSLSCAMVPQGDAVQ